ncbi:MAG: hypothetical protein NZV14_03760 [Bryobacteraceae bacterium]|nr:hypothetical protein [Bryobacteraceae bacterium]MDW8377248.1 hypothetical protein [Bryobacterales bacterium]
MINPAELVDALVAKLRAIPALVIVMEGDAERIRAYRLEDMRSSARSDAWRQRVED